MELKERLKELRLAHGMTQEAVGNALGFSAQTVSKWERGLLAPDIQLLPRIAVLYRCSIDSLFDMNSVWGAEHDRAFRERIRLLLAAGDFEGVYAAYLGEIERNPEKWSLYPEVMLLVQRHRMLSEERGERLFALADHAERCCMDDNIRNETYRLMLRICAESEQASIRSRAGYYYEKLPSLSHSREIYASLVLEGDDCRKQIKNNIFYTVDLAECGIRQLITEEMPPTEKLYYLKKAAALYEIVLDDRFGGFWDMQMLFDYGQIASLYAETGAEEEAAACVSRILLTMERHMEADAPISPLLDAPDPPNVTPFYQIGIRLLCSLLEKDCLASHHPHIAEFLARYREQFTKKEGNE